MNKKIALLLGICLLLGSAAFAAPAPPEPCHVPYNADGSVTLPPEGCEYRAEATTIHTALKNLPDGTVVYVNAAHRAFRCDREKRPEGCTLSGGVLDGQIEFASSTVKLSFSDDEGWSRTVNVPVDFEVHTGQASPEETSFPTLMTQLAGSATPGDADFESIQIVAGSDNGFEGDGFTNIEDLGNGYAQLDSHFHLSGTMHIVGTPGGRFDGVEGTFELSATVAAQAECN